MENIILLTISAFVCAAVSFTITVTSIFERIRNLIGSIHPKLDQLMHCPWCLGHYVIAIFLLTCKIKLICVSDYQLYNFLFTLFYMICIVGLVHYILVRAYEPIAKAEALRNLQKQKESKKNQLH